MVPHCPARAPRDARAARAALAGRQLPAAALGGGPAPTAAAAAAASPPSPVAALLLLALLAPFGIVALLAPPFGRALLLPFQGSVRAVARGSRPLLLASLVGRGVGQQKRVHPLPDGLLGRRGPRGRRGEAGRGEQGGNNDVQFPVSAHTARSSWSRVASQGQ